MEQIIINFYPIAKFIILLLAVVGGYNTINTFLHLLARFDKDKLDNKKDMHAKDCDADIVQDLIAKFPLVAPEFINKNLKEQNIENNQEIHELNQRLAKIEFQLSRLNLQQSMTLDEVKSIK